MMTKTGLLIITNPNKFVRYLPKIQNEIKNTLYIQFLTKWQYLFIKNNSLSNIRPIGPMFSSSLINLYRNSVNLSNIDVRVLLGNLRNSDLTVIKTKKQIEVVYFDEVLHFNEMQRLLMKYITNISSDCKTVSLGAQEECFGELNLEATNGRYDNVVLGGTFDRLHEGHKILLSEAVLRCKKKLTVGVTDTVMLKTKKLWELIESCDTRINNVRDFLEDVEPTLDYNVVSIEDMYGPTKDDPTFQLLVVSSETVRGGVKVNELRQKNCLNPLSVHSVDLLANPYREDEEEDKISSSNDRLRLLGRLLLQPKAKPDLCHQPYIIGLVGGIASGKSSVCKRLEKLGAAHVNCDEIGHNIYKRGTKTYDLVVKKFGKNILDEDQEISRKSLGKIVFSQEVARAQLNNIMWPAILEKSKEKAEEYFNMGRKIVILEAAALLQAGWKSHCHEIWTCIIPQEEAIRRLQERNLLTEEEALARVLSLPSNTEFVENANLVFCTLWKTDFTQKQVERAWNELNERLKLISVKENNR